MNEGKGLVPGYPQSMLDILGKCNIAAVHGAAHKRIRGSLLSLIGPHVIKDELLPKIGNFMASFLENWNGKTIDIQETTNEVGSAICLRLTFFKTKKKGKFTFSPLWNYFYQMALLIPFKLIVEKAPTSLYEILKPEFDKLLVGTISLPIYIPGTSYHHGFQV